MMSFLIEMFRSVLTGDLFGSAEALSGSLAPSSLLIAGASLVALGMLGRRIFLKRSRD
jgi:hypothetical protein